jgi:hypothetical protein
MNLARTEGAAPDFLWERYPHSQASFCSTGEQFPRAGSLEKGQKTYLRFSPFPGVSPGGRLTLLSRVEELAVCTGLAICCKEEGGAWPM